MKVQPSTTFTFRAAICLYDFFFLLGNVGTLWLYPEHDPVGIFASLHDLHIVLGFRHTNN